MPRSRWSLQHQGHLEEFVLKHLTVPKDSLCAEDFQGVCGDVRLPNYNQRCIWTGKGRSQRYLEAADRN